MGDCTANCVRNAPGSVAYCKDTCVDYCAQTDRRDGLTGSVNSDAGEIGLSTFYDYTNRVTGKLNSNVNFGTDRPPSVPGLDGSPWAKELARVAGTSKK